MKTATKGDKITGEDIAKAIADNWAAKGTDDAYDTAYGVEIAAEQNGAKVTFTMNKAPTAVWNADSNVTITGLDNDAKTQSVGVTSGNQAEGVHLTTLTIGGTTYTFAVGKGSAYKDGENVIDLTDMTVDDVADFGKDVAGKVASRITTAAQDNKNFKVTSKI